MGATRQLLKVLLEIISLSVVRQKKKFQSVLKPFSKIMILITFLRREVNVIVDMFKVRY